MFLKEILAQANEGFSTACYCTVIAFFLVVLGGNAVCAEDLLRKSLFSDLPKEEVASARKKAELRLKQDKTLKVIQYVRLSDEGELAKALEAGVQGLSVPPMRLALPGLPAMTFVTTRVVRPNPELVQWSGVLQGIPDSLVVFNMNEASPTREQAKELYGMVAVDDRKFLIRPDEAGKHTIAEINLGGFSPEGRPIPYSNQLSRGRIALGPGLPPVPPGGVVPRPPDPVERARPQPSFPFEAEPPIFVGGFYGSCRIDVLVAYTSDAKAEAQALWEWNIDIEISTIIDEINQTYANSGIMQRLALVNKPGQSYETCLTENGNTQCYTEAGDLTVDLGNLEQARLPNPVPEAQPLKVVHQWRDALHADIVGLLVKGQQDIAGYPTSCGQSQILFDISTPDNLGKYDPEFSKHAFSVVPRKCALAQYSLAHEFGHLGGANHDRGHLSAEAGGSTIVLADTMFRYGYARPGFSGTYPLEKPNWMTIMGKNLENNMTCPLGGVCCTSCRRRPKWSGTVGVEDLFPPPPVVASPILEDSTDNRRELNRSAYHLAKFTWPRVTPGACDPTDTGPPAPPSGLTLR